MINELKQFDGLSCTINTTEDCNLRCKYCYEIDKKRKDIDLQKCYDFIDLILSKQMKDVINKSFTKQNASEDKSLFMQGLNLDFIGGDSLMNVDLLDKVIKYFIFKLNTTKELPAERWRNNWRLSLSSNGTLFEKKEVRDFCEKYKNVLSLGVSIDGCPTIHDMNRIFNPELTGGKEVGSMSTILKWWDWYQKTFENTAHATKSTLAKCSIPYIYESLFYMFEKMNIIYINQNFIMEDAYLTEDDYILFDEQMKKCVEYVLKHRHELYWSMIDKNQFALHKALTPEELEESRCGSGCMPCLGINGKIYPCFRWAPHTQPAHLKDKMVTGDTINGFNHPEKFTEVCEGSKKKNCTKEDKCKTCEYESACSYCIGGCYAEYGDFVRTTHICEITKLQCKWAKVYWNEYNKLEGLPMEFDERYQLDKVEKWTPKYLGTNKGF